MAMRATLTLDLDSYKMNRNGMGTAGAWIFAMITLFFVIFLWQVFAPAYDSIRNATNPQLENISEAQETLDVLDLVWNNWPVVMVFAVVVFVIVRAIFGERYDY